MTIAESFIDGKGFAYMIAILGIFYFASPAYFNIFERYTIEYVGGDRKPVARPWLQCIVVLVNLLVWVPFVAWFFVSPTTLQDFFVSFLVGADWTLYTIYIMRQLLPKSPVLLITDVTVCYGCALLLARKFRELELTIIILWILVIAILSFIFFLILAWLVESYDEILVCMGMEEDDTAEEANADNTTTGTTNTMKVIDLPELNRSIPRRTAEEP